MPVASCRCSAKIVRSLDELRGLNAQPGKNIYVVGGHTLLPSLLNAGLLDELRLLVQRPSTGTRPSPSDLDGGSDG